MEPNSSNPRRKGKGKASQPQSQPDSETQIDDSNSERTILWTDEQVIQFINIQYEVYEDRVHTWWGGQMFTQQGWTEIVKRMIRATGIQWTRPQLQGN